MNMYLSVFTMKTRELGKVNGSVLRTVRIIVEEMLNVLKCMKVDKSMRADHLYPGHWKAGEEIAAEICGSSLDRAEVVEVWRVANVPLFSRLQRKDWEL